MENVHIILGAPKEEFIQPLMKEEGVLIGVDKGAHFALEEDLKVDIALGDFDSISEDEKNRILASVETVLDFPSDKDDTDAELALLYVLKYHPESKVFLYNWYGGRIDHLYSILMLVLQERFKHLVPRLTFRSAKNHISYFLPGVHDILKMKTMDYLSFILLTEVKSLSLQKVKYTLDNETFNHPMALISNEFLNTEAQLSFHEGIVAVVQSKDQ